jgi:hypothetical protein
MIKYPSLYYSKKTDTHWMVTNSDGLTVDMIQMVIGAEPTKRKAIDVQKAIDDGVLVLDERQSGILQLYQNRFHLEAKREREVAQRKKEAKFQPIRIKETKPKQDNSSNNLFE